MADSYLRSPTVERLESVLAQVKSGAIRIPPFQRDFVWTGEQRLHLLDSVRRGIPSGSLMLWRTSRELKAPGPMGPFDLGLEDPVGPGPHAYLIDGLQRTTTLLAALGRALWTRNDERVPDSVVRSAPDDTPWELFYSLGDDTFVFEAAQGTRASVPLGVFLDEQAYEDWRSAPETPALDKADLRRIREVITAFKDYLIPIVPLVTDDMQVVQKTFKRVNAGGTTMGEVAMIRALTWTEAFDIAKQLDEVGNELEPLGWKGLPEDLILKVIAAVGGEKPYDADLESLALRLSPQAEEYDATLLPRAKRGLARAVAQLEMLGIGGPGALPYGYGLVFAAEAISDEEEPAREALQQLRGWLLVQSYTGRLGNSPPQVLGALRKEAVAIAKGKKPAKARKVRRVQPVGLFNFAWARSRLGAIVLAKRGPLTPSGATIPHPDVRLASHGTQTLPQVLGAGAPGIPRVVSQLLRGDILTQPLRSIGNRVLLDGTDIIAFREMLFGARPDPAGVLESHLITRAMVDDLRASRIPAFLLARNKAIVEAERAYLAGHGVEANQLVIV